MTESNNTLVDETAGAGSTSMEEQPQESTPHDHGHDHDHHHHGAALNPELTREIEVEAPAEDVAKAYGKVVKRYQKIARIPGFRAGKVPETLIRSRFAKELRQEVMEALVSERFRTEIEARQLRPVSEPQLLDLQLLDGQPLRFKAAFEVLPEFDVTGYDTVRAQRPSVELTDAELEGEIRQLLERFATVETVEEDRPLTDGDWAEIRFTGNIKPLAQTVTEDGVTSETPEPVNGEDVLIEIGGVNTLSAFTQALRGAKTGQELTFEVVYPADFGEPRLAGQAVDYDVTVKAIKKKTYPERDEELARQLGNAESWDAYVAQLRERSLERKREAAESRARNAMLEQIFARFQFPVPESFVQQQVDARLERGLRALAQQGMQPEDMRKLDFARLREAQRAESQREVRASLVLDRIAEAEAVTIDDGELDNEILLMSLQARETYEALRERLERDGGINRMREQMRREKTGRVLYEKLAS
ncbi:MAG: trigger factor [Acidobacteriota bacterium]|nr:trigger factor [Acidobacteriota bacterium]